MVKISINDEERTLGDGADEQWFRERITRLLDAGQFVWVRVRFFELDLALSSKGAPCNGFGPLRQLTSAQQRMINAWNELGLSDAMTDPERLVLFFKRLRIAA